MYGNGKDKQQNLVERRTPAGTACTVKSSKPVKMRHKPVKRGDEKHTGHHPDKHLPQAAGIHCRKRRHDQSGYRRSKHHACTESQKHIIPFMRHALDDKTGHRSEKRSQPQAGRTYNNLIYHLSILI